MIPKFFATLLAVLFLSLGAKAQTSSSASISCSGSSHGAYFYAYAYQYIYGGDGYIQQEQHQFQFQGFLGNESFALQGIDGTHAIYESANYTLAVPYLSNSDGLFYKEKFRRRRVQGPTSGGERRGGRPQWVRLCPN